MTLLNSTSPSRDRFRVPACYARYAAIDEHRRRVETHSVDVPGLVPPTWAEIAADGCKPWDRERIVVDTAGRTAADKVRSLRERLAPR
jgi:signal recognition particle GTPase